MRTILLTCHGLLTAAAAAAGPIDRLPEADAAKIAAAAKKELGRIPGLSVAVVKNGEIAYAKGFGMQDVENRVPAKAETVYRLASVSKAVTAVAAMRLVELGRLKLDDAVRKHLPDFPKKKHPITARHLLGHQSGVRHYKGFEVFSTKRYLNLRSSLGIFAGDPLRHEPGTRFTYTTYGYTLLGRVMEAAAGDDGPFFALVEKHVREPAAMDTLAKDDSQAIIPNRAQGYYRTGRGELRNSALADTSYKVPGGGMCGSALDLAKFAKALMGDTLLRAETRDLMWTPGKLKDGKVTRYGLGWNVASTKKGDRRVGHNGAQQRVSTMLRVRPDRRFAVAVMSNLERSHKALGRIADAAERVCLGPPAASPLAKYAGLWQGKLQVGPIKLRVVMKLKAEKGKLVGTVKFPDQNPKDLPLDPVALAGGELTAEFKPSKITFRLKLAEGDKLEGTFSQGPVEADLTLAEAEAEEVIRRPQTPKPPFPYEARGVKFPSRADGVTLAGTLTLPKGDGPFPAAVLVSGSGAQDRDEFLFGHRPFMLIADALTRKGVAVLRYDDRGTAESTGKHKGATSADFAEDARGAIAFLRGQGKIDAGRVGLIGHSEGGVIGTMIAAKDKRLAFLAMMAGPTLPGNELLALQAAAILKRSGADGKTIRANRAAQAALMELLAAAPNRGEFKEKAPAVIKKALAGIEFPEDERKEITEELASEGTLELIARQYSAWMRYYIRYDPRPDLRRAACPVLAMFGGKDLQVPAAENAASAKALFTGNRAGLLTVKTFGPANHLFQKAETGLPDEYGEIEQTLMPEMLDRLADWVRKNSAGVDKMKGM